MKFIKILFVVIIFASIGGAVLINTKKDDSEDKDDKTFPSEIADHENFKTFQKEMSDAGIVVNPDEIIIKDQREIYNPDRIKVFSQQDEIKKTELEETTQSLRDVSGVTFSPDQKIILDYRNIARVGASSRQIRLFGIRSEKILDAPLLDCAISSECIYIDGYFIDNDSFVLHEISLARKDPDCVVGSTCSYSIKIHYVELMQNQRSLYESTEFEAPVASMRLLVQ